MHKQKILITILFCFAFITTTAYAAVTIGSNSVTSDGALTLTPATIQKDAIGNTSTSGLTIQNSTAATAGITAQYSPASVFCGAAWKSNATAASETDCFKMENRPVTGGATTSETLALAASLNAGSYSDALTLSDKGALSFFKPSYTNSNQSNSQFGRILIGGFNTDSGIVIIGNGNVGGDSGAVTLDARLSQLPLATENPGAPETKYFNYVTGFVNNGSVQEIWNGHFFTVCITDGTGVCTSGRHNDGTAGGEALPLFDIWGGGRITQTVNSGKTTGISVRNAIVPGYVLKTTQSSTVLGLNLQEWSPLFTQCGSAWNTVGAVSEPHCWGSYVETTDAAGATKSKWHLARTLNTGEDGTFSDVITANSAGVVTFVNASISRSSGFGTNADASFAAGSSPYAFDLNIGTGGAPTSGVVTLPAAAHGWICQVRDITTPADNTYESSYTTTSATFTTTVAWTANDHIYGSCTAF